MYFEAEFRDELEGFADLLQYVAVIDRNRGVVVGKAGQLMKSFDVVGRDADSSSGRELEAISQRVNSAMIRLNKGWMFQFNSFRFESSGYPKEGFFPDPATRLLDEERRQQYRREGRHYEAKRVLTFTWMPPPMLGEKVKSFVRETSEDVEVESIAADQLEYFLKTVDDIVGELRLELVSILPLLPVAVEHPSLETKELIDPQLGVFHWCATGIRQHIRLPPEGAMPFAIDYLIGSQDFVGGDQPRIGKKFIKVISIDTLPDQGTHAGVLEILNRIGVSYRWSTRFIIEDDEHAKEVMEKHYKKWNQQVRRFVDQALNRAGRINEDALKMTTDINAALNELRDGRVKFGYYTGVIVLYNDNAGRLEADASQVVEALRIRNVVAREENLNAVEAFLGSLPGHGYENVRRPMIHTLNVADLLPLTAPWQGLEENPSDLIRKQYPDQRDLHVPPHYFGVSSGSTPVRLSMHVGDVGHALMVGRTGGGKSTKLCFLMSQFFRYPRAKVFGFDKGWSMFGLNQFCKGLHYNIMDEDSILSFFPLANVDKVGERAWAEGWIETMLKLNGVEVSSAKRRVIRAALVELGRADRDLRTLTHFVSLVQDREMSEALRFYTTGTGAGGILDGNEDNIDLSRFTVFEMEELMSHDDKHVAPVLMVLFRMIERQLDGSPVMIVLDEAWLMLKHPLFQEILAKWLKVLRKANAFVVFATQELGDLDNSPIRDTIYSACMTRIFLPDTDADTDDAIPYYKRLGLSSRQIKMLTKATPKRDYYYTSPYGSRMYQLGLGPVALALCTGAGPENTREIREIQQQHGQNWMHELLVKRGVPESMLERFKQYQDDGPDLLRDMFATE